MTYISVVVGATERSIKNLFEKQAMTRNSGQWKWAGREPWLCK